MLSSIWMKVFSLWQFLLITGVAASNLAGYVSSDGVVYADDKILQDSFNVPRDYTALVLFTTSSSALDCQFCRILGPNFLTLADSYEEQLKKNPAQERKLFFVFAEAEHCMNTLRQLGMSHVPNIAVYEPTKSKKDVKKGIQAPSRLLSFTSSGDQVDFLARTLNGMGFAIKIKKPFPYYLFAKGSLTFLATIVSAYVFWDKLVSVWQSKKVWLALSLMCIIMFISGHMFNVTRGVPFTGFDGNSIQFIEPGFGSQVAMETQILAVMYALLSFTTIGLIKFIPMLQSSSAQTLGAIMGTLAILIFYSIFLELFQIKLPDFPIKLLPIKLF